MNFKRIIILSMFLININLSAEEFRVGDKYYILQYRANIRSEPSRESNVIAILSLDDTIEIVEYSDFEETINETHGFWIKIRHGNIIGYTFSGNIAMRSLVTKLAITDDNDKIIDEVTASFHARKSMPDYFNDGTFLGWHFKEFSNIHNELFFYINNQRINTDKINIIPGPVDNIIFEGGKNSILLFLNSHSREGDRKYIYKIGNDGIIEFIGKFGNWYPDWFIKND